MLQDAEIVLILVLGWRWMNQAFGGVKPRNLPRPKALQVLELVQYFLHSENSATLRPPLDIPWDSPIPKFRSTSSRLTITSPVSQAPTLWPNKCAEV